ncbi:C1 peptidase family protein [Aureococcus anophagefferens]|uniref:C1 peptidase family protein n=1 Tax=Aureococcus anophagefferens TaxID=44056 RepID=A0ABR1FL88_AURAN
MRRPMAPLALALSLVVAAFVALRLRATPAAVVSFRSTGRASDDDADDAPAINDGGTKLPPDAPSLADVSDEEDARFAAFRASRGRAYGDDEAAARRPLYVERLRRSRRLNAAARAAGDAAVLGETEMMDWTAEEVAARKGYRPALDKATVERTSGGVTREWTAADDGDRRYTFDADEKVVDWRAVGMTVGYIQNQGQCWAFSVAQQVQSEWYLDGNPASEFSAQQIISCDDEMFGCGGGGPISAYSYIKERVTPGLSNLWYYPYVQGMGSQRTCLSPKCTETCRGIGTEVEETLLTGVYAQVANYSWATKGCFDDCEDQDLYGLRKAVAAHGPASICVNAANWDVYAGGVMSTATCGSYNFNDLDHCVGLVGFNMDSDPPYWIVKNQWSTTWGVDGYIYLDARNNTCGVADTATFAKVFPPDGAYRPHDGARVTTPV